MHNLQRKLLSQNFLSNQSLVSKLVGRSSIGKNDLVLEIGAGNGVITSRLATQAREVIAVEIDAYWYQYLRKTFGDVRNLSLYNEDILKFKLPKKPYKVFANIPFAIEGKIIRKLIEASNPPQDCHLVVMRELAVRLCARAKENMFSLMYKPWFDFSITHEFSPKDFSPIPSVVPVLFRFTLKKQALLPQAERGKYQLFIQRAFGTGQSIRQNLRRFFPISKVDATLQALAISKKTKPTQLDLVRWLVFYRKFSLLDKSY